MKKIKLGKPAYIALFALASCAAFFLLLKSAARIVPNSDFANQMLEGWAMLRGNFFLKGWSLPVDNFFTLDNLFYYAGIYLSGFNPGLLHVIPTIVAFLIIVTGFLFLIPEGGLKKTGILPVTAGLSLIFSLLILRPYSTPLMFNFLTGPFHNTSLLYSFVSLLLLFGKPVRALFESGEGERKTASAALGISAVFFSVVLVTAGFIGDPFVILFFAIPVMAVSVNGLIRYKKKFYILPVAVVFLSFALSKAALYFIFKTGFSTDSSLFTLIGSDKNWGDNIGTVFSVSLTSLGVWWDMAINPVRQVLSLSGIFGLFLYILKDAAYLFIFFTLGRYVIKNKNRLDDLSIALLSGALMVTLACVFSYQFYLARVTATPNSIGASRYFYEALIFFAFFFSRVMVARWDEFSNKKAVMTGSLAVLLFLSVFSYSIQFLRYPVFRTRNAQYKTELRFLNAHGLKYGYGGYWKSGVITVLSGNRVKIRQVWFWKGCLRPYYWIADIKWYGREHKPDFIIWTKDSIFDLTPADITHSIGKPSKKYYLKIFGGEHIWVYNRPIDLSRACE